MRFSIERDQLIKSINHVMNAISSRTAIPILTGMKIEMEKDQLILTGSDSNISIQSVIPVREEEKVYIEDIEEGSIVLQAHFFSEIIKKLPKGTVKIEADQSFNVKISAENVEFRLNGQDASEYPILPKINSENQFQIESHLLKNMIKQTVFATSVTETRPILTGIHIKFDESMLSFTATDSHRLALKKVPMHEEISLSNIVVPGKSLNELNKILTESDEKIDVRFTNQLILFKTKNITFLSRLLDGNYPDTSRLIPDEGSTEIQLNTKHLIQTIERASLLVSEERNNVVRLTTMENNQIEISSHSPEIGQVNENLQTSFVKGEQLKISFSAKYMLEALRVIEEDEVIIYFTGSMRPFVMKPIHGDSIIQLITPVRTF